MGVTLLLVYKIVCLGVGFACIYLGYRLLMAGVLTGSETELQATFAKNRVLLKRASPGVVFGFFGVLIICTAILKGIHFDPPCGDVPPRGLSDDAASDTTNSVSSDATGNASTNVTPTNTAPVASPRFSQ